MNIDQARERLYASIGLNIDVNTSEAIALSIIAEIPAVLAKRSSGFLKHRKGGVHHRHDPLSNQELCLPKGVVT